MTCPDGSILSYECEGIESEYEVSCSGEVEVMVCVLYGADGSWDLDTCELMDSGSSVYCDSNISSLSFTTSIVDDGGEAIGYIDVRSMLAAVGDDFLNVIGSVTDLSLYELAKNLGVFLTLSILVFLGVSWAARSARKDREQRKVEIFGMRMKKQDEKEEWAHIPINPTLIGSNHLLMVCFHICYWTLIGSQVSRRIWELIMNCYHMHSIPKFPDQLRVWY